MILTALEGSLSKVNLPGGPNTRRVQRAIDRLSQVKKLNEQDNSSGPSPLFRIHEELRDRYYQTNEGRNKEEPLSEDLEICLFAFLTRGLSAELVFGGHREVEGGWKSIPEDVITEIAEDAFIAATLKGRLNRARSIARTYLLPQGMLAEDIRPFVETRLNGAVIQIKSSLDPDSRISKFFDSIRQLGAAGYTPSVELESLLYVLDPCHHKFILNVVLSDSPATQVTSFVKALYDVFWDSPNEFSKCRRIIGDFFGSHPNLFNSETLPAYVYARKNSTRSSAEIVRAWKELGNRIRNGVTLTDEEWRDPFLPVAIKAVYGCSHFGNEQIVDMLSGNPPKVGDHSTRLAEYVVPDSAFQMALSKRGKLVGPPKERLRWRSYNNIFFDIIGNCHTLRNTFQEKEALKIGQDDKLCNALLGIAQKRLPGINGYVDLALNLFFAPLGNRLRILRNELSSQKDGSRVERYHHCQLLYDFYTSALREVCDSVLADQLEKNEEFASSMAKAGVTMQNRDRFVDRIADETVICLNVPLGDMEKYLEENRFEIGEKMEAVSVSMSLRPADFFARSGAKLCTYEDLWSWDNPDYLQMIMVDDKEEKVVGVTQLNIFENRDGKRSALIRINPTENFLARVHPYVFANEALRVAMEFCAANKIQPYLPAQGHTLSLTNRFELSAYLQSFYGEGEDVRVVVGYPEGSESPLVVNRAYRLNVGSDHRGSGGLLEIMRSFSNTLGRLVRNPT